MIREGANTECQTKGCARPVHDLIRIEGFYCQTCVTQRELDGLLLGFSDSSRFTLRKRRRGKTFLLKDTQHDGTKQFDRGHWDFYTLEDVEKFLTAFYAVPDQCPNCLFSTLEAREYMLCSMHYYNLKRHMNTEKEGTDEASN